MATRSSPRIDAVRYSNKIRFERNGADRVNECCGLAVGVWAAGWQPPGIISLGVARVRKQEGARVDSVHHVCTTCCENLWVCNSVRVRPSTYGVPFPQQLGWTVLNTGETDGHRGKDTPPAWDTRDVVSRPARRGGRHSTCLLPMEYRPVFTHSVPHNGFGAFQQFQPVYPVYNYNMANMQKGI